jgi:hypothetical protein
VWKKRLWEEGIDASFGGHSSNGIVHMGVDSTPFGAKRNVEGMFLVKIETTTSTWIDLGAMTTDKKKLFVFLNGAWQDAVNKNPPGQLLQH